MMHLETPAYCGSFFMLENGIQTEKIVIISFFANCTSMTIPKFIDIW